MTLTAISLLAFASDEGITRNGIHYRCLPRRKTDTAVMLGWLPLLPCVGTQEDGVSVGLFAWLCRCEMALPHQEAAE